MMSFPQVLVDGELLGGFAEVQAAAESGRLDELLSLSGGLSSDHPSPSPPAVGLAAGRVCAPRRALAGLAHVGAASGDDHLDDRAPAPPARLARARCTRN